MSRFAYLGPAGTHSHRALLSIIGPEDETEPCATIEEVFTAVERGKVEFGLVPIENSVEGAVNATLDSLAFDSELEIQQEVVRDIHHALCVAPGVTLAEVTQIVSHPQALAQSRRWITSNLLGKPVVAATSTAEAVRMATEQPGVAAIGSEFAAETYGAEVLFDSIEDYAGNQTRFVLIGRGMHERTGEDKTSLALFMKADRPGTLNMILSEFAFAGINLTKIQSRPTRKALGDYMFFIDLIGHVDDENVRLALDCLRLKLRRVKVLGSYPRAVKA
ncbi:MAG: prephenate dehydratase [Actinobacteria bacterium]|nr:prephenate dehydratase [Actinomycetota bacterium]MCL5887209.1 prephenate dehydratase [Actinomycetota bacterium]